jgi:hypothetical protein
MFLASAYPESAISALSMMVIAFVMFGCLAIWIGMVFIADREPRKKRSEQAKQSHAYTAVVGSAPGKTAEGEVSEPGQHREVAA